MLRRNVGGIDRFLRVILGAILFLGGLFLLTGKATLGAVLVVVGLLALLSGIIRFCMLYIPFGISTAHAGRQRMVQGCDCDAFMKEMQATRNAPSSGTSKEDAREPVGTNGSR